MKFTLPTIALILSGTALALPAAEQRDTVQTVHLTFYGGPASYEMAFPADGTEYPTSGASLCLVYCIIFSNIAVRP